MKLLVILFILKLYVRVNIFKYIEEKYGRDNTKLARTIEKQRVKLAKVYYDIKFLIYCKKNNLTPTLARPRFAVKISSYLRDKISRQILESKIKNKHRKRKQLIRQLKENNETLTTRVGFIYNTALYIKINKVIKKEKLKWEKVDNRKIEHLRKLQNNFTKPKVRIISNIIHNFSSYHLTPQEEYALSFSLDQHIPTRVNQNKNSSKVSSITYKNILVT